MNQEEIIGSGILELYAAGMTTEAENRQVAEWLMAYPAIRAELDAIETAIAAFAREQAVPPPAGAKARIEATLFSDASVAPIVTMTRNPRRSAWRWAAAASIILAAGLGWMAWSSRNNNDSAAIAMVSMLPPQEIRDKKALIQHHNFEMMARSSMQTVMLHKGAAAPTDCVAMAYWDKSSGTLMFDPCKMPDAPAGAQYQLWAIIDGKPVDAGVIFTAKLSDRYRIQLMKNMKNATAFAVTLEKEGGSVTPSLDKIYVTGEV